MIEYQLNGFSSLYNSCFGIWWETLKNLTHPHCLVKTHDRNHFQNWIQ